MRYILLIFYIAFLSCSQKRTGDENTMQKGLNDISAITANTVKQVEPQPISYIQGSMINTGNVTPQQVVAYATSLVGIPYKYGSTDPSVGFDCSGFITYVFNHFNIAVPRSSIDFTNVPTEIPLSKTAPGDLILFTGTDSTIRTVGHMGIITSSTNGEVSFIHSTSGKANGVTITTLQPHYVGRFVKIIHVFGN